MIVIEVFPISNFDPYQKVNKQKIIRILLLLFILLEKKSENVDKNGKDSLT